MNSRLLKPVLLCLAMLMSLRPLFAAYDDPSLAVKVVSTASGANQPIVTMPASGAAAITLVVQASNFSPAPTSYAWSQIAGTGIQNSFASKSAATLASSTTSVPQVNVNLPTAGVYQFQVIASNGTQTATASVWVQAWEAFSGLNPLRRVGRNPGLAAPSSVRMLSRDPGPFCHPRLFFSRSDWAELNAKTTSVSEVSTAVSALQSSLNANFDSASGVLKNYATILAAYADGGYDAAYFTNTVQPFYTANASSIAGTNLLGRSPGSNFPDALLAAAYLAWVGSDPTLPQASVPLATQNRFRYLAKLTAAAAKVELAVQASAFSSNFGGAQKLYDLAVVYDLLYDWMTASQQGDARDYLFAIGYGVYNTYYGGISRTYPGPVPFGKSMNGDFPNLADGFILAALVIEGEEASVSAGVQSTYGAPVAAATGPNAWPNASPASVNNLYRQCRWLTDGFVTPWGTALHHHAYLELSMAYMSPATLALARRGQNQFVTTPLYQASLSAFNLLYTRPSDGKPVLWDHHDSLGFGNGPGSNNGRYILKYMFPDDPMVDYTHRAFRNEGGNGLAQAMFGVAPGTQSLAATAQSSSLPLTRFDPMAGAASTRNTWAENDLQLYFESRPDVEGHMHAEANTFSLYANGRAWSSPPGYHCTIHDLSAGVLIQDPTLASDPATQGYIGESPSSGTTTLTRGQFPTPPAKFIEALEDPGGQWTLFAGDATSTYNYAFESSGTNVDTGKPLTSYYYDGVLNALPPGYAASISGTLTVKNTSYNPVQYALRTVFTVRGARPYVLVLDDITADGSTQRNYRWNMPAAVSFGPSGGRFVDGSNNSVFSSMAIQPGATATEAVLYHSPIDDGTAAGKPRLLVRDVTEQSTAGQPAIVLDKRPIGFAGGNLTYGVDNNSNTFTYVPSSRVLITRQNVVSPQFKVLLFPYLTGQNTPTSAWDATQNVLSIDLQNGFTDRITIDKTQADHRTRVVAFSRTKAGRSAPTLNLPANIILPPNTIAHTGQPGATASFTVTATDDLSAALTPAVSSPSGSIFPIGVNVVQVTATDAQGQVSSGQFTVTVLPAAPVVQVTSVANLPGGNASISLSWTPFVGATAYSVKRSSSPGGPYTVVSDKQTGSTFSDSGLSGTGWYYVVTAWLDALEGPASNEIALAGNAPGFTGQLIGTASEGFGFYNQGSTYLLTCTGGQIGNFSDKTSTLTMPWTGDGTFTVRVVSVTGQGGSVSAFGSYGIVMRQSTTANDLMASSAFNTFVAPFQIIYRSTVGSNAAGAGPFGYTGAYPAPVWLRLVRTGQTMTAFYSLDGLSFVQTAAPQTIAFNASTLVGLAAGGQNTTLTSILFDNVIFLGTPTAAVSGNAVVLSWQSSPGLTYNVQRATTAEGPFTTIATGLTSPTHTDPDVSLGTTYFYRVSTSGSDGGASTSPTGSLLFPSAVTAPTNLSLTPAVGQLTLNWTASPPESTPTYRIERATSAGGPFTTIASGITGTTFTDAGFQNGTTYFYRVVAENGRSTATSTTSSGAGSSGTFIKANNTTALDLASSWSPASVPGSGDAIQWTGTYANGSVSTGSGLNVSQLVLTSPSTAITINAGSGPLVLGSGGVDLSASTQSLTINAPVTLAANQTWSIATSRTLQFSGAFAESGGPRNLALTGSGTLRLSQPLAHTGSTSITSGSPTLIFDFAGAVTPFAGPFAGISTGTLRAQQATSVITLDSIALPAGANVALGTLAGTAGATWVLDGASSAIFSAASNVAGLNLTLRNGQLTYNAVSGNTDATNVRIEGGTFFIPSGIARYQIASDNQTFQLVGGTADLRNASSFGFRIGGTGSASQAGARHVTATQTGGTLLAAFASLGGTDTSAVRNPSYTLSAGTFTLNSGGGLTIGADTAGTGMSTFTLSGTGKLIIPGTLSGAQASARQVFAFTGGTLVAATINATNLRSSTAASNGTFTQSGGTLAPGDDGTAGRTQITGNYSLATDARITLDLGGTTQANGFQSGNYDLVTVSGTTSLAGNLTVRLLPGFTPSAATTFTVLTSTGTLSGAFANVAFGSTLVTAGGQGTFIVNKSGNTITLSNYTALTPIEQWRWQAFGTQTNTGTALDTADADGDGVGNLIEYATAMNPAWTDTVPQNATKNVSVIDFVYTKNKSATDVTFVVEWSDDLKTWSTTGVSAPTILSDNGTTQQIKVTVPAGSGVTKRFVHLKVTRP